MAEENKETPEFLLPENVLRKSKKYNLHLMSRIESLLKQRIFVDVVVSYAYGEMHTLICFVTFTRQELFPQPIAERWRSLVNRHLEFLIQNLYEVYSEKTNEDDKVCFKLIAKQKIQNPHLI